MPAAGCQDHSSPILKFRTFFVTPKNLQNLFQVKIWGWRTFWQKKIFIQQRKKKKSSPIENLGQKFWIFFLLLWSNFFVQILLRWHRHRRIKAKEVRYLKLWSFLFGWVTIWKGCRLGQHICQAPEVFLLGRAIIEFLIRAKRAISLDSLKKTDPLGVPKPEC